MNSPHELVTAMPALYLGAEAPMSASGHLRTWTLLRAKSALLPAAGAHVPSEHVLNDLLSPARRAFSVLMALVVAAVDTRLAPSCPFAE